MSTSSEEKKITQVEIKGAYKACYNAGLAQGRESMYASIVSELEKVVAFLDASAETNELKLEKIVTSAKETLKTYKNNLPSVTAATRAAMTVAASALAGKKRVNLGSRLRGAARGALEGFFE